MDSNLDKYQKRALKLFLSKYNLFITGGAGSGKSYLIKCINNNKINLIDEKVVVLIIK